MRVPFAALACLALIASSIPLGHADATLGARALVWAAAPAEAEAAGARVVAAYDAFLLVQGTPAVLQALAATHRVEALPTDIVKGPVRFDPARGEPAIPAALRAAPGDPHTIVQFAGPVKAAWRAWLAAQGDVLDYVPHHAFVVRAREGADLAAHPAVVYVGPFHAAYKLHGLVPAEGPAVLDLRVWPGEAPEAAARAAEALGGAVLLASLDGPEAYLRVALDAARVAALARAPAVAWVEPVREGDPLDNAQARWVTQSGISPTPDPATGLLAELTGAPTGASVHAKGLSGRGQVIAVADGGIDTAAGQFVHEAFDDPAHGPFAFGVANPQHRKMQAYFALTEGGTVRGDFVGYNHGVHTSGSAGGDAPPYGTYNGNDGQSFGARLVKMDLAKGSSFLTPLDYRNAFQPTYDVGARLHSNSYGYPHDISYTVRARQNDLFAYENPDFLIFRSMGNTAANTIRPEAVAKNVVGSGATKNGADANSMAGFSSRGPTQDGRVKPTFVAPGENILSAVMGGGYGLMSGTSMSTPTSAGVAGLVRQYFEEGWYPTGEPDGTRAFNPSSALVRGVLVNSAVPITGWGTGRPGLTSSPADLACVGAACPGKLVSPNWPNGDMGWGEVRLDNALAFPGDRHGILVVDGASVGTGQALEFRVRAAVGDPAPLKITLAWTDAPAIEGANPALVNDLDLSVSTPLGVDVLGNVFVGVGGGLPFGSPPFSPTLPLGLPAPGGSLQVVQAQSAPGGSADRRNVEEQVVLSAATEGEYVIRVTGANVPSGAQAFALVVVGNLA